MPADVKKGRNLLAAAVVAGHAFKHLYNAAWANIVLPEIKIDMTLSGTRFGVLTGTSRVTSWATTMVAGYLGDRFSHRAPVMLGMSLGLMGLSYFLAGVSPNFWFLIIAVLLIGIGPSLYHPPAISSLSRRFPDRRGLAISLHGTGGSAGEVLGPLVAAGVLALATWRGVLQLGLLPALLAAVSIWVVMRNLSGGEVSSSSFRHYLGSLATLLKNRPMQALVAMTALRNIGQSAVVAFLPVYLREDLDFSATRVAVYLSLAQVVGLGAQPAMGHLSDKLGRKAVLVPTMAALGLLYTALRYADPGMQLTLTILAMGAFHYSIHTIFIAAAVDAAGGEMQSTVVALIYGAGFLGTVAPVLAGVIADSYGVPNAFLFAGSVVLATTLLVPLLRLPQTAAQAAHSR